MTDLEKAEAEVRHAYVDAAIHYQLASAKYHCAPVEDRAKIVEEYGLSRVAVEQRIAEAEAKLKEHYMSIKPEKVTTS